MKKIPRWIFLNYEKQPPVMVCKCCGESREIHLTAAANDFIKQAEAFAESHKYCNVKK